MSKYIIELDDRIKLVTSVGVTEHGVVYTTSDYVHNLEELNSDYINEHFAVLQETAYQKGFEDGKALEDNGCEGCRYEPVEDGGYPCSECANACLNYYMPKLKDDKIKAGDEVVSKPLGLKGILLEPETEDVLATIIVPSQRWRTIHDSHDNLEKTGKHYDIEKLLAVLRS